MADEQLQKWRKVLRRFLGKASTMNYRKIIFDLILVSSGLKPSLLFDYACIDLQKAREMLDEIETQRLLRRRLDVICVGQDIFIADLNVLVRCLKDNLITQSFCLVDVTGSLPEPSLASPEIACRVTEQFAQALNFLEERLSDRNASTGRSLNVPVQDDWNLTSLYGFLLSYPAIYWFAPSRRTNCLASSPLALHTVKLRSQRSWEALFPASDWSWLSREGREGPAPDHTVFSFSVPLALHKDCKDFIEKWKVSLLKTAACFGIEKDLVDIDSEVVVLDQVAL